MRMNDRFSIVTLLCWSLTSVFTIASAAEPQTEKATPQLRMLTHFAKISAAGAAGQDDKAEQFLGQGKELGLSEEQMYEAILNLLPYVGYPRTLNTMSRFQKQYPHYVQNRAGGQELQPTEPWQQYAVKIWGERGERIRQQLGFGGAGAEKLVNQVTQLSPELAEWVTYDDFGRIFGRPGLSLLEREAIVLGALIAQGVPEITVHYKALRRVGGSDELVDMILKEVTGVVDEKTLVAARKYIAEARQK